MRTNQSFCVAAGIAVLTWLPVHEEDRPRASVEAIDRATRLLLAPNPSETDLGAGFTALLDAAVEAATAGNLPAEVRAKLASARARFAQSTPVDEQGVLALGACHRLLNSGRPFEFPGDVRTIDAARERIRQRLGAARTSLVEGKAEACVRALVEAAMMIVTPREASLESAAPIRVHLGASLP
jgi:hypothetical protein